MTTLGFNPDLSAHCQLTSEAKSPMTLEAWAKGLKGAVTKGNGFKEFKESELKPGKYGGHDAFEYDYSGEAFGAKTHYRVFFLSVGNNFAMLECFTDPAHWEAAQKSFAELANNVK
jgi:hypothetical protein